MKKLLISMVVLLATINVFAEGYAVNLMGTKQNSMGHTGTGYYLGASNVFFNPGAIVFSRTKFQFEIGGSLVFGKVKFYGQNSLEQTDSPVGAPFYFYGTYKINEKLSAGLGIYTPFGNSLKWGDNWSGSSLIQDISVSAIYIQPTLAFKISDQLSFGAGFTYVVGNLELNKSLPLSGLKQMGALAGYSAINSEYAKFSDFSNAEDGQANLQGSPRGYGFNLGLFFKPNDKLSIGLTYRSEVKMKLDKEGEARFTTVSSLDKYFPDTKFSAELPLIGSLNIGASYKVTENLTIAVDINYNMWDSYKSLDFDFVDETSVTAPALEANPMIPTLVNGFPGVNQPILSDSKSPKNYKNVFSYRLGVDYKFNQKLNLRAGVYYDLTPIQEDLYSPETPGANKLGLSLGAEYKITSKLSIDASFLYVKGQKIEGKYPIGINSDNTVNYFGGEYKNQAFIPSVGISYSF